VCWNCDLWKCWGKHKENIYHASQTVWSLITPYSLSINVETVLRKINVRRLCTALAKICTSPVMAHSENHVLQRTCWVNSIHFCPTYMVRFAMNTITKPTDQKPWLDLPRVAKYTVSCCKLGWTDSSQLPDGCSGNSQNYHTQDFAVVHQNFQQDWWRTTQMYLCPLHNYHNAFSLIKCAKTFSDPNLEFTDRGWHHELRVLNVLASVDESQLIVNMNNQLYKC
jgi:hypothetical protein